MKKRAVILGASLILTMFILNCVPAAGQPQPPPPTIDQPRPIVYVAGTTGHEVTWHPYSEIPDYYWTKLYGDNIVTPFIIIGINWSGGPITVSVDGLAVGKYCVSCTVVDKQGRSASSWVDVTVVQPPSAGIQMIIAAGGAVAVVVFLVAAVLSEKRHPTTIRGVTAT